MFKFLQKIKTEKKGTMAIEIVIGCLVFLILLCFLMDITILTWKFSVISQTNTYLARTVGIQGGVNTSLPTGFPGDNNSYETSSELVSTIKENFGKAGISPSDYTVKINGITLSSSSKMEFDYRTFITTEIAVKYKWTMISNFIPGSITNTLTSKRSVMSEFKYRYDNWNGE